MKARPALPNTSPIALATFSGLLLSFQSILVKHLGAHLHSQEILCGRSLTAAVVIGLFLRWRGQNLTSPRWPGLLLLGTLGCIAAS